MGITHSKRDRPRAFKIAKFRAIRACQGEVLRDAG